LQHELYSSDTLVVRGSGSVVRYAVGADGVARSTREWRGMGTQDGIMLTPGGQVTVIATAPSDNDKLAKASGVGSIGNDWDGYYYDLGTGQIVHWRGKVLGGFGDIFFSLHFSDCTVRLDPQGVMALAPHKGVGTGVLRMQYLAAGGSRSLARTSRRLLATGATRPFRDAPNIFLWKAAKPAGWPPPAKPPREQYYYGDGFATAAEVQERFDRWFAREHANRR
jgi:hypothetical protein